MTLLSTLESILFVASKPLTIVQLAKALDTTKEHIADALETLILKYNHDDSGIHILREIDTVQMATNPAHADVIEGFVKHDVSGELPKAQLETLTVIAYRSPITRADLEQIRGVNCAIILRNLMMRGLVEQYDSSDDILPTYVLTMDALSALGIADTSHLPQYDILSIHDNITYALTGNETEL
ncbi:MAG: SMC-Scp complex subunit ScpB [Candidatus Magasanikbacteria bacterium CG10_big_fil_rev_8_21_14_0_10_42_10]|uniref:SMC-Scp complex subunit ScpB n=2 Tax=Candidatus Magasanikiibacteriota TaxID=1752731 RepID=A0A2H0TWF0_9BACT|nr:MAG: SMC-Scp complex subunit ScpB [Candidatus Magasanikbacteria bacterium CG10_big_fil_rev_8_21_14_0_10_42_10]PIZ92754.1 MAG: SMC-Scp complex subunit ScpB [Candidatus Magasanikbacteria bacterium CG_4_10_14_0_2_um_filter_41_10]